jgi:hypothetical protein
MNDLLLLPRLHYILHGNSSMFSHVKENISHFMSEFEHLRESVNRIFAPIRFMVNLHLSHRHSGKNSMREKNNEKKLLPLEPLYVALWSHFQVSGYHSLLMIVRAIRSRCKIIGIHSEVGTETKIGSIISHSRNERYTLKLLSILPRIFSFV